MREKIKVTNALLAQVAASAERDEALSLAEYEQRAMALAIYPDRGTKSITELSYVTLGLVGEAGEVAEKVKKVIRDKAGVIDEATRDLLIKEAGDVCWYLMALARVLDCSLETVLRCNLEKLESRKARGVLGGSGDAR